MGFNTVYRFLSEIFPQVDARLLKAVAIEHNKDADAAANIVLTEILPYLTKHSMTSSPLPVDNSASSSACKEQTLRDLSDAEQEEQSTLSRRRRIVVKRRNKTACSSPEPTANATGCATNANSALVHATDSACLSKGLNASMVPKSRDAHDGKQFENNESEEVILLGNAKENGCDDGSKSNKVSNIMNTMTNGNDGNANASDDACASTKSDESVSYDKGQVVNVMVMSMPLIHENSVANGSLSNLEHSVGFLPTDTDSQLVPSSAQEEHALQLGIHSGTFATDSTDPEVSGSSDLKSEQVSFISENDAVEDDSMINTVITRSGQICRIDLLEEIIQDAKNNKKTLFTAMESVMNMIREVELKEKAAEEAKAEAAMGGLNILMKVEELKQMLSHTKNANDMRAGEVYGEKAILATEARELQNRLFNLSEERDKSLAILDEMRETLEGRLAAAEEMRKAAEEEKLEKEESARSSLAEIEAMMEKVVQESKVLQQEAEENSKLQEFLMDRGRVIDSLQGEISVICQDVRFLKEKFDERVPLSKSLSSSQTTCILASSGSSIRSSASLVAANGLTSETPEDTSSALLIDIQSPKSGITNERTGADRKELLDDGWDFFDNDTESCGRVL